MINRLVVCLAAAVIAMMLVTGCVSNSADQTNGGSTTVDAPGAPPIPNLTSPQDAVRSYLDEITFAYHSADSSVASQTMTAYEWVRVDAYIEKNRQEGRGIEQTVTAFEISGEAGTEPTVTVSAEEAWMYRYFSLEDGSYQSEELTAAYQTEYTVVMEDGLWKVDKVKATAQGEVE